MLALAPAAGADPASAEAAFVADLNSLRASKGLPALAVDPNLATIARAWSGRMAAAGDISHNPNLTTQAPPTWRALGENVGMGPDEPSLNAAFINSPHHYANMINASYNGVGVGVVMGTEMFVTVDFEQLPTPPPGVFTPTTTGSPSSTAGGSQGILATVGSSSGSPASAPQRFWLAATDGGVFAFGGAGFFGSMGGHPLNQPIVGMASTPSGNGYWLVAKDGGLFSFGDARFFGSTGSIALNKPIVGMASTPGAGGYWLVASDGGLFSFGTAGFFGSTAGNPLPQPIVGITASLSGNGYLLAAADGNVFAFGDVALYGSAAGVTGRAPVIGVTRAAASGGYELATGTGLAFSFGATGSAQSSTGPLNQPIVAIAGLAV
jgi:hypothetical protein